MTATRIYLIHCDGRGCTLNEAADGNGSAEAGLNCTLQEYRAYLVRNGWTHRTRHGLDFCPDCASRDPRSPLYDKLASKHRAQVPQSEQRK